MKNHYREIILEEAIRIGDQILSHAQFDKSGLYWFTLSLESEDKPVLKKTTEIYNGVSGIVLFLIELYRQTNDEKYLDAVKSASMWITNTCLNDPVQSFSFLSGKTGCVYTLLKMFELTKDEKYFDNALRIAESFKNIESRSLNDIMFGTSGILIGLIHIHSKLKEKWLLNSVNSCIKSLIDNVNIGKVGLYGDRDEKNLTGLCGFSHGAAGIGYTFLELGYYFNNDSFLWIAEQFFAYEDYFFNKTFNNWPDFRRNSFSDFMCAWCHGAPGIGLSRLRAYDLLKKNIYKNKVCLSIDTTLRAENQNYRAFILCHGKLGNAELYLEAFKELKNIEYYKYAIKIALKAIKDRKKLKIYNHGYYHLNSGVNEDYGFFLGNAGIGYFYLKLLKPENTSSILCPRIENRCYDNSFKTNNDLDALNISKDEIKKQIVKKSFIRTVYVFNKQRPKRLKTFFKENLSNNRIDENKRFQKFICETISSLHYKKYSLLSSTFLLEKAKLEMDTSLSEKLYLRTRTIDTNQLLENSIDINDGSLWESSFQINKGIKILLSHWVNIDIENFENGNPNPKYIKKTCYILLKASDIGVYEIPLNQEAMLILRGFKKFKKVGQVIESILKSLGDLDEEKTLKIKNVLLKQIKELVLFEVLVR